MLEGRNRVALQAPAVRHVDQHIGQCPQALSLQGALQEVGVDIEAFAAVFGADGDTLSVETRSLDDELCRFAGQPVRNAARQPGDETTVDESRHFVDAPLALAPVLAAARQPVVALQGPEVHGGRLALRVRQRRPHLEQLAKPGGTGAPTRHAEKPGDRAIGLLSLQLAGRFCLDDLVVGANQVGLGLAYGHITDVAGDGHLEQQIDGAVQTALPVKLDDAGDPRHGFRPTWFRRRISRPASLGKRTFV